MTDTAAWGYGIATIAADGTVLDTWYPSPQLGELPAGRDPHIAPAELEGLVGEDARRNVRLDFVTTRIALDAAPADPLNHTPQHQLTERGRRSTEKRRGDE